MGVVCDYNHDHEPRLKVNDGLSVADAVSDGVSLYHGRSGSRSSQSLSHDSRHPEPGMRPVHACVHMGWRARLDYLIS